MIHGASFDVEDYRQILRLRYRGTAGPVSDTFDRDMEALCALLDETSTRATFFVLGEVAEGRKESLRRWHGAGHEIAAHGWDHTPIWQMDRAAFRADLERTKKTIEDVLGAPVAGYRAPVFSVRWDTLWALDEIAAAGFTYDSSIVPVRMSRYGLDGVDRAAAQLKLPSQATLVEFPLPVGRVLHRVAPVGGGGYFRLFPLSWIRRALAEHDAAGVPFVMYCHPDEMARQRFRAMDLAANWPDRLKAALLSLRSNLGRKRVPGIARALLTQFKFAPLAELAKRIASDGAQRVLAAVRPDVR
jgi:polysaccharide deacetylase family protein (PEP-CTERM system associated)